MGRMNDGWSKFLKTFDEWRERDGGSAGKFFADWKKGASGMRARRLRRFIVVLAALCSVVGISVVNPGAAQASTEVCQLAPDVQFVCFHVAGSGGHVDSVMGVGNAYDSSTPICDYWTDVRISGNGNPKYAFFSNWSQGGCSWGVARNIVKIKQTYPKGFYVCMKYWLRPGGVPHQQGQERCVKLT